MPTQHHYGTTQLFLNAQFTYQIGIIMGVVLVGDLITNDGSIMSIEEVRNSYNIPFFNFLNDLSVKSIIRSFFKEHALPLTHREKPVRPLIPLHLQTLMKNHKGSRHIYNVFNSNKSIITIEKWNERLNTIISEKQWKIYYKFNIMFQHCTRQLSYLVSI